MEIYFLIGILGSQVVLLRSRKRLFCGRIIMDLPMIILWEIAIYLFVTFVFQEFGIAAIAMLLLYNGMNFSIIAKVGEVADEFGKKSIGFSSFLICHIFAYFSLSFLLHLLASNVMMVDPVRFVLSTFF